MSPLCPSHLGVKRSEKTFTNFQFDPVLRPLQTHSLSQFNSKLESGKVHNCPTRLSSQTFSKLRLKRVIRLLFSLYLSFLYSLSLLVSSIPIKRSVVDDLAKVILYTLLCFSSLLTSTERTGLLFNKTALPPVTHSRVYFIHGPPV